MGADEKDRQDACSAPALSAVLLKSLAREKQCFAGGICPANVHVLQEAFDIFYPAIADRELRIDHGIDDHRTTHDSRVRLFDRPVRRVRIVRCDVEQRIGVDKNQCKLPIAAAVAASGLPNAATAYTLRHSTITDLVAAGLPLLTIAQVSGTSAEMIERHYGHLVSDAAVKALGKLAL